MEGRAIDTIGSRGMHSYEVAFDNWYVPGENLIGGVAGQCNAFYLQMKGFENGRLKTAARAIGVMQAAYATRHCRCRVLPSFACCSLRTASPIATAPPFFTAAASRGECPWSRQGQLEAPGGTGTDARLGARVGSHHHCVGAPRVDHAGKPR